MQPKCKESLSRFAFNCNLRHYSVGTVMTDDDYRRGVWSDCSRVYSLELPKPLVDMVGRCRLTLG